MKKNNLKLRFLIITFLLIFINQSFASRGIRIKLKQNESSKATVSEEVTLYNSSYGLVIGIDDYSNGWPKLSSAVKDAKIVAKELEKKGFIVTLKINPDSENLTKIFKEFFIFKGEKKNSRLFVWFAGHGYTQDNEGYIIPRDAPKPDQGAKFRYMAFSMRRFGEYVRQAKSKHVLAVFDSCFSGTIFTSQRSAPPPAVTIATTKPVRQFLSSGDSDQEVSDNGLFRKLFVRALKGDENADANNDGYLTGSELGMFLTNRVTNLTESAQTPRYGKLRDPDYDRGDFVFIIPDGASYSPVIDNRDAEKKITDTKNKEIKKYDPETEMWELIRSSENPQDFKDFLISFPRSSLKPVVLVKLRNFKVEKVNKNKFYLKTQKKVYSRGEPVIVEYDNLPGNKSDWFTIVKKSEPDNTYGSWDYTNGNKKGAHVFKNVKPGEYEARLYFNWSNGDYTVQYRYSFRVK